LAPLVTPARAQLLVLDNPGPTQHDAFFGKMVAAMDDVDGDGLPEMVVSAPGQWVAPNFFQGQVFVFSGATGALLHTLNHPDPADHAYFGEGLAALDDVDGDGVGDLVTAAGLQPVGENPGQGRAFVFSGRSGALIRRLDDPVPQAGAHFGIAVAAAGDVDRDGTTDVLVGATNQRLAEPGRPGASGQAFLFSGATGQLLRTIDPPEPQDRAQFGIAVAGAHDADGDGVPDLLIGAPGQDDTRGAAYVVSGATGQVVQTLRDPEPRTGAFGWTLDWARDLDGDGAADAIVGAPLAAVEGRPNQGQAFLFSGRSGRLLHQLRDPQPVANSFCAQPVGPLGDVDSDGVPDVFMSAEDKTVAGFRNLGQMLVFSGRTGSLIRTLDNPNPQPDPDFGHAAALAGDLNRDGVPDMIIGAQSQDFEGEIAVRLPGDKRHRTLWFGQAYVLSGAGVHDLAVTTLSAPATVRSVPGQGPPRATVRVKIQNRGPRIETIPDRAALERLIALRVESLGACADASPVLSGARVQPSLPLRLEPKQRTAVLFRVAFPCANDPGSGAPDYRYRAAVSRGRLDGVGDSHPADDACPRKALPFPDYNLGVGRPRGIMDRGCGARAADGSYGADVVTDVVSAGP
jgi:hypothetical protein